MPAKKKIESSAKEDVEVIIEDLNELPKRKSTKKAKEATPNLEEALTNQFNRQIKVIAILLFLIAVLVLVALVSYTPKDASVSSVSLSELLGLVRGNEAVRARLESAHNWLGVFGAFVSNALYNYTFGYSILVLPFLIALWAKNLYQRLSIPDKLIKRTTVYLIYALLFSIILGAVSKSQLFGELPIEWSGAIGTFIGFFMTNILGSVGAILVSVTMAAAFILYITNFKAEKFIGQVKERYNAMQEERANSTTNERQALSNEATDSIQDDVEEPARIIKRNLEQSVKYNQIDDEYPMVDSKMPNPLFQSIIDEESGQDAPIAAGTTAEVPTPAEVAKPEPRITIFRPKEIETEPMPVIERIIVEETIPAPQAEAAESNLGDTESDANSCDSLPPETTPVESNRDLPEEGSNDTASLDGIGLAAGATTLEENEQRKRLHVRVEKIAENDSSPKHLINTDILDEKINYTPPSIDLLNSDEEEMRINHGELKMNARILQEKLETFKIAIENMSVTPGPVVTQYEFVPAPGIKISKIESLADDMAMALKARGIRIIAPIPGKGTIGIEIPNHNPSTVRFGNVVAASKFKNSGYRLPIAFGKTISGEVFCADLAKMPHLLIAGATGSGKSVGINTIIMSLLYSMSPKNLKFVIVDPKKVELRQYAALENHFLAVSPDLDDSIITDPADAVVALKAACAEMDLRYNILAKAGQRNIADYNQKVAEGKFKDSKDIAHKQMPYIVVIIDELADLMLTAAKEVETPIIRLAQLARAVGIHLVLATQRPSVDVITGIIKANFPARAAYLVASKVDSRTILDVMGADQLLGNGDMLFLAGGSPKPIRVQNAFVSTDEVEAVCDFIGNQDGYSQPYMLPSLQEKKDGEAEGISREDRDPLFEEAARLIIEHQQGSVSLVQRRLKVGYARAARIIDELERAGVVGPFDGSKARAVYMESAMELESIL